MARLARVVVPGLPHHVTQRGNRRQPIFFEPGDHIVYRKLLADQLRRWEVEAWAYCLMPNHVHLILTPKDETGLSRALAEAHRRYTTFVNARQGWSGHLFQGRFASVVMDERHLLVASRYIALNPVRAGLVERPEAWPWSSVRAHLAGRDDALVSVAPLLARIEDFAGAITPDRTRDADYAALRRSEGTGRPLGGEGFLLDLEARTGRALIPRSPGRKPRGVEEAAVLFQH